MNEIHFNVWFQYLVILSVVLKSIDFLSTWLNSFWFLRHIFDGTNQDFMQGRSNKMFWIGFEYLISKLTLWVKSLVQTKWQASSRRAERRFGNLIHLEVGDKVNMISFFRLLNGVKCRKKIRKERKHCIYHPYKSRRFCL